MDEKPVPKKNIQKIKYFELKVIGKQDFVEFRDID